MVVFSFQSIISIQCTVVLANSIYSAATCTNIGLFMGYFLYHLVQSAVAISSNRVAAILSLPRVIVEHTKQVLLNFRWKSYHIA